MTTSTLAARPYVGDLSEPERGTVTAGILRVGRRWLWPYPSLYQPIGRWRGRPAPPKDADMWVAGFPRSGNTFMWQWLRLAFPSKNVIGHLHMPPAIISEIKHGSPGILVLRPPLKAAISWSIFYSTSLKHSLEYYTDFYRVLWRHREKVLVATFEKVTKSPREVIDCFSSRFNLKLEDSWSEKGKTSAVLEKIDAMSDWIRADGTINEMVVARPSAKRKEIANQLETQFRDSPMLQRKCKIAERLYEKFRDVAI